MVGTEAMLSQDAEPADFIPPPLPTEQAPEQGYAYRIPETGEVKTAPDRATAIKNCPVLSLLSRTHPELVDILLDGATGQVDVPKQEEAEAKELAQMSRPANATLEKSSSAPGTPQPRIRKPQEHSNSNYTIQLRLQSDKKP